jgi:hypothetical protein
MKLSDKQGKYRENSRFSAFDRPANSENCLYLLMYFSNSMKTEQGNMSSEQGTIGVSRELKERVVDQ